MVVCLTRLRRVCYRTSAVHEIPSPLVHFWSDRHASPYWTFIRRWISMGFTHHYLKNEWQNVVLCWCMLLVRPPSLHYNCAVMLHSCILLPHFSHSSNHEYHCCQLIRQSSFVSNFYHTFKVFIWLSLVTTCQTMLFWFNMDKFQWPKFQWIFSKAQVNVPVSSTLISCK
jgi:hypothetical protein